MGPGCNRMPGPIRVNQVALRRAPCETTVPWKDPGREGSRVDARATSLTIAMPHRHAERRWLPAVWSDFLILVLGFLVLYPTAMLLIGALTTTNPVVEGYHFAHLSVGNFLTVA